MSQNKIVQIIILIALNSISLGWSAIVAPISSYDPKAVAARKITIHPVQPIYGINSGLVIFIGHLMAPPFKVEYRGYRLFINDVQIWPTPFADEESAALKALEASLTDDDRKREACVDSARDKIQEMAKIGRSKKEILAFARSQKCIVRADWPEGGTLILYHKFHGTVIGLGAFPFPARPGEKTTPLSKEERDERDLRARVEEVHRIEDKLRAGAVLIFSELGGWGERTNTTSFPSSIPGIMEASNVSDAAKFNQLMKLNQGSEHELAADILANYDFKEWAIVKSEKYDGILHKHWSLFSK